MRGGGGSFQGDDDVKMHLNPGQWAWHSTICHSLCIFFSASLGSKIHFDLGFGPCAKRTTRRKYI